MVLHLLPGAVLVSIVLGYNVPTKSCTLEGNRAYSLSSTSTATYPGVTGNTAYSPYSNGGAGSYQRPGSSGGYGGQGSNSNGPYGGPGSSVGPGPYGSPSSNSPPGSNGGPLPSGGPDLGPNGNDSGNTNPDNFGDPWWWDQFPPNGPFADPWWYDPQYFDPTWFWPWMNDGNGDGDSLGTQTTTTSSTTTTIVPTAVFSTTTASDIASTTASTTVSTMSSIPNGCPEIPTCTSTVTQSNFVTTTTQTVAISTATSTGITTAFVTASAATVTTTITSIQGSGSISVVSGTSTVTTTVSAVGGAAPSCISSAGIYPAPAAGRKRDTPERFAKVYDMQRRQDFGNACSCAVVVQTGSVSTSIQTVTVFATVAAASTVTSTVTPPAVTTTVNTISIDSTVVTTTVNVVTVTSTVTQGNSLAAPTSNGLKWYWFANTYAYELGPQTIDLSQYAGPSGFVRTGILQNFGYNSGINLNGFIQGYTPEYELERETVLAHGYLYAQQAGTYTFTTNGDSIDDQLFIFSGQAALGAAPAFAQNTADINVIGTNAQSKSYTLVQGQAIPITIISINGSGPKNSVFTVIKPDGTSTQDTTGLFVQHCPVSEFVGPSGDAFGSLPAPLVEDN